MGPPTAVTVVIPTKDRAQLLAQTVVAGLAQRDVAVEVIIVDDGSAQPVRSRTTGSASTATSEAPGGSGTKRRAALAMSPWTAFTDDDDLWAPEKLPPLLAVSSILVRRGAGATGYVDEGLELLSPGLPPPSGDVSSGLLARNSIPGGGSGVLADTELLRELGGFDPDLRMCADYELWIRLALASPLAAVGDPLLAYRVHGGGMSRQLEVLRHDLIEIERLHGVARRERGVAVHHSSSSGPAIGSRLRRRVPSARDCSAPPARASPGGWQWRGRPKAAVAGRPPLRDRRRVAAVPAAWADELESWLGPLRAGSFPNRIPNPAPRPWSRPRGGAAAAPDRDVRGTPSRCTSSASSIEDISSKSVPSHTPTT